MILDLGTRSLTDGGKSVRLSRHEVEAFAAIMEGYPSIVTRAAIIDRVWPGAIKSLPIKRNLIATLYNASCKMVEAGIPVPFETVYGCGLRATCRIDIVGSTRISVERKALEKATAFLMTHPDIAARLVVLSLAA